MIDQPEAVAIVALDTANEARALAVVDAASYARAADMLLSIKALLGRIADTFRPHIKRAHDAHKALLASEQAAAAPLLDAERWVKGCLIAFDVGQEAARLAEERRRQEQARAAQEARRITEAAALEMEGMALGDAGLLAEAQRVLDAPDTTPTVIVPSYTPKVAGVALRETWAAEVTNLAQLAAHAGASPEHLHLVQPNQTALNALARALRDNLRIPGVRPVKSASVAVRR